MENKQIEWQDVKGLIRRRKNSFLIVFSVILLASIITAFTLPPIYRARTTILIEDQQIPEKYVESTVTTYAEERLNSIKQQVLSSDRLKEIINDFNLYPEIRKKYNIGEAVSRMQKSIELENESAYVTNRKTGKSVAVTMAFNLYYEGKNPETVQKVTNVLGNLFLEEDHKIREKITKVTTNFLEKEIESLKKKLNSYDKEISEFKKVHFSELPHNNKVNLENVARLEREFDHVNVQLQNLQERKILLEGQLSTVDPLLPIQIDGQHVAKNPAEQLKYLRIKLISLQSKLSDRHPDIKKLKREIKKLEEQVGESAGYQEEIKRIQSLRTELSGLKGAYGPKHPDIVKLKKEIQILENSIGKKVNGNRTYSIAQESPDNPAYINLQTQIASITNNINNLQIEKQNIREDLEKYRKRIENAPEVEKKFNKLTRDYNITNRKYNETMDSLMAANVAKQMQEGQFGQRFEIKNYAFLPGKPYKPNRIAIILLGIVLAFGLGFGIAALQEFFDHSVKCEKELAGLASIPVLTVIPKVETREEKINRAFHRLIWVCVALGFFLIGAKIVNEYVMPLNQVLDMIVNNIKNM